MKAPERSEQRNLHHCFHASLDPKCMMHAIALEGALSGRDDVNNNNTGGKPGKDGILLLRPLITTVLARRARTCCGWCGVAGDVAVLRRLLDTHGADLVDAVYRDDEWRRPITLMRSAACAKNDQIIETLIAYGATDLL